MPSRRSVQEQQAGVEHWTRNGKRVVLMPERLYLRLMRLAEQAIDRADLARARAKNAGDKRVAWEDVRKRYIEETRRTPRKSKS